MDTTTKTFPNIDSKDIKEAKINLSHSQVNEHIYAVAKPTSKSLSLKISGKMGRGLGSGFLYFRFNK